jgi:hypothetical protein
MVSDQRRLIYVYVVSLTGEIQVGSIWYLSTDIDMRMNRKIFFSKSIRPKKVSAVYRKKSALFIKLASFEKNASSGMTVYKITPLPQFARCKKNLVEIGMALKIIVKICC